MGLFDLVCEIRNLNTVMMQILKVLKELVKEKDNGGTKK